MKPKFFAGPPAFRRWLQANHDKVDELWVGYHKKATGLPSITWPESVDEALCFGWIDGVRKSIDEDSYRIRFTPRRANSKWSDVNIKRAKRLKKLGKVARAGLEAFERRKQKGSRPYSYEREGIELAKEYEDKLRSNEEAWSFFHSLAPSVRKVSIAWVMSAKKEETRLRRLGVLIGSSEKGQKIPALIIGKKKRS
jgi:uncharacterized protein YdeI (YjbR/CyaY-like superfamily)